jgi:outer membrane protein TolC
VAARASLAQYRAGTATYLAVVTSQSALLTNQRTAVQLLGRQLAASAALVKALGGGWNTAELDNTGADAAVPAATTPAAAPAAVSN